MTSQEYAAWIEAIATVLLFVAAVWAGVYTTRLYGIEIGRERDRELEARAEQASRVAVWLARRKPDRGSGPTRQLAVVLNNSNQPVYRIDLEFQLLAPDGSTTPMGRSPTRLYGPIGESTISVPAALRDAWTRDKHRAGYRGIVQITFTDAVNRRWRRDYYGRLEELGEAPALKMIGYDPQVDAVEQGEVGEQ